MISFLSLLFVTTTASNLLLTIDSTTRLQLLSHSNNTLSKVDPHTFTPGIPSFKFRSKHNITACFAIIHVVDPPLSTFTSNNVAHGPENPEIPETSKLGCIEVARGNIIDIQPNTLHHFDTSLHGSINHYRIYTWESTVDDMERMERYDLMIDSCCAEILHRHVGLFLRVDGAERDAKLIEDNIMNAKKKWSWQMTKHWEEQASCSVQCEKYQKNSNHQQDEEQDHVKIKDRIKDFNEFPLLRSMKSHVRMKKRNSPSYAGRGLLGAPFWQVGVGYGDVVLLSMAIDINPHSTDFVEFGTFQGVTSLYLGMAARMRNGRLDTFDLADYRSDEVKRGWLDDSMYLHLVDIEGSFKNGGFQMNEIAKNKVENGHVLFVDGGLKRIEMFLYASVAPIGMVVVIHDVKGDQDITRDEDEDRPQKKPTTIPPHGFEFLASFGYVPLFEEIANDLGAWSRVWRRDRMIVPSPGMHWIYQEEVHAPRSESRCGDCLLDFIWTSEGYPFITEITKAKGK
jgi:hypothetical protein